jgi:lipoate-protein ligase A
LRATSEIIKGRLYHFSEIIGIGTVFFFCLIGYRSGFMSEWEIIDSGCQSAEENMRFDAGLLERAESFSRPILHFYEWTGDSATYGYFIDPSKLLNLDQVKKISLQLARRPTGGGIVFHHWDMAFSVLVPATRREFSLNTLENYAFVNRAVLSSVKEFLKNQPLLSLTPHDFASWDPDCLYFCMAKPTKYDVMWEGKKIAGAAQRKTRKGFLHQGTIALMNPNVEYLNQVLLPGTKVREAMLAYTCPLLGKSTQTFEVDRAKQCLRGLLATHLSRSSLES